MTEAIPLAVSAAETAAPAPPVAATAAPALKPAPPAPADRGVGAIPGIVSGIASMAQALLAAIAFAMMVIAATFVPASAVQEIYQLMLITSGLTLFAMAGIWSSIDALRRRR